MEDAIRSDKVKAEEVKYLWLDRIPLGMPTIVAGRPGEGKSLFSAFLAAEVTRRGWSVIFSNMEDPIAQIVRPRLEAAGAVLERVHFWTPYLPRDMEELEEMILKTGATMLIIDKAMDQEATHRKEQGERPSCDQQGVSARAEQCIHDRDACDCSLGAA